MVYVSHEKHWNIVEKMRMSKMKDSIDAIYTLEK